MPTNVIFSIVIAFQLGIDNAHAIIVAAHDFIESIKVRMRVEPDHFRASASRLLFNAAAMPGFGVAFPGEDMSRL